jgi:hypothetical protein
MSEIPTAGWSRINTHPYRRIGELLSDQWTGMRAASQGEEPAE